MRREPVKPHGPCNLPCGFFFEERGMRIRRMKDVWAPSTLILVQAAFAFVVMLDGCRISPRNDSKKLEPYVPIREWKYIVVHHSATPSGNAERFDRFHREERGWSGGLGYHFVIGNGHGSGDGEIETGPRWLAQENGAHAGITEYNQYGIGICLVGDFTDSHPTEKQMQALIALCRDLMKHCKIDADHVYGHRELPGATTDCPGKQFSMEELRKILKKE
jgi:hypothetical protein